MQHLGRTGLLCFGLGDLLLVVHGEEQVVPEAVAAVRAATSPIVKDFRDLRQPHVQIVGLEMHGAILDGGAVGCKADLRNRRDKISFQPDNLKTVCCNPRSSLERG